MYPFMKVISLWFQLLLILPTLVSSQLPSAFTLNVHAPGTPLDGKPVNANEQAFWIGKPSASYCPRGLPPRLCPSGNETIVTINQGVPGVCRGNTSCGSAAMYVMVPGGQQIYVDPALALRYTVPHSAFIPAGSSTSNFSLSEEGIFGWNFPDAAKALFSACPKKKRSDCEEVAYQIYGSQDGKLPRYRMNMCLNNVTLKATPAKSFGAWQYI